MSVYGMLAIGVIYGFCAFDQFINKGNTGLAIAFAGWFIGQMGMAYAVR